MLSHEAARAVVIEVVSRNLPPRSTEPVDLAADPVAAVNRILAENLIADRDYPPFHRSIRDGFACRASDAPAPGARLRLLGESRAGAPFAGEVVPGACVQIFTGAAVPAGADAVVMQEYARSEAGQVFLSAEARPGQHIVRAGAELRGGEIALPAGARLGYAELGLAAQLGHARMRVNRRPRVAILSTGDEVVPVDAQAGPFQIRDSNSVSLAAQVAAAGGEPLLLGNSGDQRDDLHARIAQGLAADALILTGGVSVGKYDLVEPVLRELGAEFLFDQVAIRPGKPAVFGICGGKPVFGLPGNPVSTMVTFEILAAPAIEALAGARPGPLPLFHARLLCGAEEKPGLAHFLPARVTFSKEGPLVEALPWQGSGDLRAVAQANCFLVLQEPHLKIAPGDWASVLPRRNFL
ncbi:MAG TPA: gephyrin-like molybdotransferase Glp [Candidatus Acidoferrales bacterium]|nr:gephyrin-like molybdotransferase Glp [Candidatus Acidoferrales bacterium]